MSQKIANFGEEFICIMERSDINNIMTTTHDSCNILADLLVAYGVKYAIISPKKEQNMERTALIDVN